MLLQIFYRISNGKHRVEDMLNLVVRILDDGKQGLGGQPAKVGAGMGYAGKAGLSDFGQVGVIEADDG